MQISVTLNGVSARQRQEDASQIEEDDGGANAHRHNHATARAGSSTGAANNHGIIILAFLDDSGCESWCPFTWTPSSLLLCPPGVRENFLPNTTMPNLCS
jgi:hypothetical protein